MPLRARATTTAEVISLAVGPCLQRRPLPSHHSVNTASTLPGCRLTLQWLTGIRLGPQWRMT